ncbi:hypothetical protein SAY87_003252 [Trapa incisa]|uniref:Pectinesterase inhibitor domain-containing protein n=1 Tax=Trapa incisa TaxID=236973 RepID=A0AAN7KQN2_9MYRT|nr:hypothetical protein SAY87_003252 [Trapa incisa]
MSHASEVLIMCTEAHLHTNIWWYASRKTNILAAAEKYIQEHGTQEFESLIHRDRDETPAQANVSFTAMTITIGLLMRVPINLEPSPEIASLSPDVEESIRTVCSVTEYPETCFLSILPFSSSMRADPKSILKISLEGSVNELLRAVNQLRDASIGSNPIGSLGDYETLLEEAMRSLNESATAMEAAPGEALTDEVIKRVLGGVSAARTNLHICLYGLSGMDSTVHDEVTAKLQWLKDLTSNTLVILSHVEDLRVKFNMEMH